LIREDGGERIREELPLREDGGERIREELPLRKKGRKVWGEGCVRDTQHPRIPDFSQLFPIFPGHDMRNGS
jgi:hypothetical protein